MAAIRLGFSDFFMPLYEISDYKTSLLDGSLSEIKLFSEILIPLATAYCDGDKFKVAEIVKKYSPLFHKKGDKPFVLTLEVLSEANKRTNQCMKLWDEGNDPSCKAIIQVLLDTSLFEVPESIATILDWDAFDVSEEYKKSETFLQNTAWDKALDCPVSEVQKYSMYINGKTSFATHQGVKGLQFPRVMAIIDDASARGHSFQYKKLFDMNEADDKTLNVKRLFYVICSRTRESLALVAYSDDPVGIQKYLTGKKWVLQDEIVVLE
jgi:DNA helicase-2/ATP-dependent DNA helicase PcrA